MHLMGEDSFSSVWLQVECSGQGVARNYKFAFKSIPQLISGCMNGVCASARVSVCVCCLRACMHREQAGSGFVFPAELRNLFLSVCPQGSSGLAAASLLRLLPF